MTEDGTKARGIIAVILAAALMLIIGALIFVAPRADSKDYLTLLIGALIANVTAVIQFYFGSSSGSKVLTANQQELAKVAVESVAASAAKPPNALDGALPAGTQADPVVVVDQDTDAAKAQPKAAGEVPLSVQLAQAESEPGFMAFRRLSRQVKPTITSAEILAQWRSKDDIDTQS
jgi:hypothetical protein